ncbi:MAG: OmpA family protein [Candidatus Solibacter sp.]
MNRTFDRIAIKAVLPLLAFAMLGGSALAQTTKIQGMIKARSGATMVVHTASSPDVVVLLADSTQVAQIQGTLKVRRKEMSMAALIPGLEVQVEGTYNAERQLAATSVKFQGNDLERAQSIQAGMHETEAQAQQNKAGLEQQSRQIEAHKGAIDAAIARFGQLDDYYIFAEVTVLFGNGKTAVEAQYKPKLLELAQNAKTIDAYMIQVVGYASPSGSVAVNQKLSEDRASAVTNILLQEGHVPLTNLLAPGAMGETNQAVDDPSREGEAQNRRVVVRVLQNKGIAGLKAAH